MKLFMLLGIVMLLSIAPFSPDADAQQFSTAVPASGWGAVPNWSFETDANGDGVPDGWLVATPNNWHQDAGITCGVSVVSGCSLMMSAAPNKSISTTFPVNIPVGSRVTGRMYVKGEHISSPAGYITYTYLGANGQTLNTASAAIQSGSYPFTQSLAAVSVYGNVASVVINIEFTARRGAVYFDVAGVTWQE